MAGSAGIFDTKVISCDVLCALTRHTRHTRHTRVLVMPWSQDACFVAPPESQDRQIARSQLRAGPPGGCGE